MRSLLRSAKALSGKAGPRGTGSPGPAPVRAEVRTLGAGPEVVGKPLSPRLFSALARPCLGSPGSHGAGWRGGARGP